MLGARAAASKRGATEGILSRRNARHEPSPPNLCNWN